MKQFLNALKFDLTQNYVEAIEEYEYAIKEEFLDINLYINLAFLYWASATQFVWADNHGIPDEVRNKSVDRYINLLKEAKVKFPKCAELYFWEKYFWHRLVFDPLNEEDVLNILSKYESCHTIPYFFYILLII